jgi:signal transduction histidine kinase
VIQVCDRGVGIPLQDQSRIFERFYRVDEARSRMSGGHGLGLAIVKTLVEGMGGSITVQSKPGEGSTFTLTLPT